MSLLEVGEERSGSQCEDGWLGHIGIWSGGGNGKGAASVIAGPGSMTEDEVCHLRLPASLQWRC